MKIIQKLLSGVLASAGLALPVWSASAGTVTYNEGDLLLGFNQSGATNDYVIDIGPASNYINAVGSFQVVGLGNLATDLSSVALFGSNWSSNAATSPVQWGVVGTVGSSGAFGLPAYTLFLTSGRADVSAQTAALKETSSSGQANISSNIDSFASGVPGFNGSSQTANSTVATIQATTQANSWASFNPNSSAFGKSYSIEQPASGSYTGPTNSVLDLYELQPHSGSTTPGTYLGDFSLDSSGNLTFNSATAAVPEPATYAYTLTAVAFFLVSRRPLRRLTQKVGQNA